VREVNAVVAEGRLAAGDRALAARALREVDRVLGVLHQEEWVAEQPAPPPGLADAEVERLVGEREAARRGRDFARSDALRDQLREGGVLVEDTAAGPRWRRQ
jgi:cysteinyl-tRNA synthetase